MERDFNKAVVWNASRSDREVIFATEDNVPKGYIKPFKLFIQLLFNKRFRYAFNETVKYALRHYECWRGTSKGLTKCISYAIMRYKNYRR